MILGPTNRHLSADLHLEFVLKGLPCDRHACFIRLSVVSGNQSSRLNTIRVASDSDQEIRSTNLNWLCDNLLLNGLRQP